jgi:hypothetical protein
MNGMRINDGKWEEQQEILSNAHWDAIFELLQFLMNDIQPSDFYEFSPNGNVKQYFKNKYQVKIK